jgi:outer membrane receptor protein involved in Fe transport
LSSPLGGSFDYIAGLYYQTSEHDYADQIIVSPTSLLITAINLQSPGAGDLAANTFADRIATVDNDVLSAFAQFNWHVNDVFTLQVGGRITSDDRDGFRSLTIVGGDGGPLPAPQFTAPVVYADAFGISSTNLADLGPTGAFFIGQLGALPVAGSRDKTKFSPEVKLVWNAGDAALVYLSWSEGFKSGSFDFRANNRNFYPDMETSFEFEDEEATNTELGAKFTLADGAIELNSALFFTEYDDLQISIYDGVLGFNVGNAAAAEIKGIEVDLRWAATDYLTISGGLAYTDFEFTDFENGQCYFGAIPDVDLDGDGTPELCSYTGNSNQMVSDLQGNVSFDFRVPVGNSLEFSALFDVFYTDDYDASATFDPKLIQDSYTMLNARLALGSASGRWEIALLAKNLSDEKVLSFGGDTPLATTTFFAQSNYAFYKAGRTLSLQAQMRF